MELLLKIIWKLQLIKNAVMQLVIGLSSYAYVLLLWYELCWLPVDFWVHFKVLVVSYKALHGIGLCYLRNCLFPIVSACMVHSGRVDTLHILSIKYCHLGGSRTCVFYVVAPSCWSSIPPEVGVVPSLLGFLKDFKIWLCSQALS